MHQLTLDSAEKWPELLDPLEGLSFTRSDDDAAPNLGTIPEVSSGNNI